MLGQRPAPKRSRPYPLPAPVGGINGRDSIAAMKATDAIDMINWFPTASNLVGRRGYQQFCDVGTGEPVDVIPYSYGSTKKLLAASDGEIFDITTGTPSSLETGLTSTKIQHVQFNGRLFMCNGDDAPYRYFSNAVDVPTFTADTGEPTLDTSKLNFVFAYKSRLYFVEKGTQRMWYAGVNSVQGAMKAFDFSLIQGVSGELMILTALTRDGGNGTDDLFVAIFSSGEVIVYSGSFPGDDNWSKVGTYKIGKPLSRFAHTIYGDDIIIATTRGYESLQRSTREGEGVRLRSMLSEKIHNIVNVFLKRGPDPDWRLYFHIGGRQMIVQIPVGDDARYYHVRNIDTGAWTTFNVEELVSWADYDGTTMVGGATGLVHTWDTGYTDNGNDIVLSVQPAWSALGSSKVKTLHFMYFNFSVNSQPPGFSCYAAGDYGEFLRSTTINMGPSTEPAYWNEAYWNEAYWTASFQAKEFYHKHVARGRVIGIKLVGGGYRSEVAWNATTFIVEDGGLI